MEMVEDDGAVRMVWVPPMPTRRPPPPPPDHPDWFNDMARWFVEQQRREREPLPLPMYGPPNAPPREYGWGFLPRDLLPDDEPGSVHSFEDARTFPGTWAVPKDRDNDNAFGKEDSSDITGDGPEPLDVRILYRGLRPDERNAMSVGITSKGTWGTMPEGMDSQSSHHVTVASASHRTPWIPTTKSPLAAAFYASSRGTRRARDCLIARTDLHGTNLVTVDISTRAFLRRTVRESSSCYRLNIFPVCSRPAGHYG